MFRIRIIPATIIIALLLMIVKIMDVTRGTESQLLISTVSAEQSNQAPAPKEIPPKAPDAPATDAAKPADAKAPDTKAADTKAPDASAAGAAKPADAKAPDAKAADAKKPDAKADAGKKEEAKSDKAKNPAVSDTPGDTVDHRFTNVEVELLQNLARRRDELDRWEKNIQIKEEALNATEKRIDDKIGQIDAMKKEVGALLAQYNEKEDAKIGSLVKIYENMKPQDAARIFNEIEMPILLLVIDKMSEKKAAPILADMDAKKAKQITVQLAEQRRVNSAKLNTPYAPAPLTTAPVKQ